MRKYALLALAVVALCAPAAASTLVRFPTDGACVTRGPEERGLASAAASIQPGDAVVLVGRADFRGGRLYNLDLSRRRAEAVQKFLVERGVPPAQVDIAVAYGEERPIAPNDAVEGHLTANRSVEVVVVRAAPAARPVPVAEAVAPPVPGDARRNRVYGSVGFGPVGLESSRPEPGLTVVGLRYAPVFGVGLMRRVSARVSLGVEGFSNNSYFGTVGYDF